MGKQYWKVTSNAVTGAHPKLNAVYVVHRNECRNAATKVFSTAVTHILKGISTSTHDTICGGVRLQRCDSEGNLLTDLNAGMLETTGIATSNAGVLSSEPVVDKGAKYRKTIRDRRTGETLEVDIYDVLEAFRVHCPSRAHAIKKILMPGERGDKDFDKDMLEGINSINQAILLEKYRD